MNDAMPFPACAGMNRNNSPTYKLSEAVPRMRGDEPDQDRMLSFIENRSPHARG